MTVKLNGKDYVTVAERVEAALASETSYSMANADTFNIGDRWFYRVVLQVGDKHYVGTAEIKFNAPSGSADHKNPIECAETSAVGRALGFAGFGVIEGIASADEMQRSTPTERNRARSEQPQTKPAQDARNKLASARANASAQTDIAQRLKDGGLETIRAAREFIAEALGREVDILLLKGGKADVTMGEVSTLLLELNKRTHATANATANANASGARDLSELPVGANH